MTQDYYGNTFDVTTPGSQMRFVFVLKFTMKFDMKVCYEILNKFGVQSDPTFFIEILF